MSLIEDDEPQLLMTDQYAFLCLLSASQYMQLERNGIALDFRLYTIIYKSHQCHGGRERLFHPSQWRQCI